MRQMKAAMEALGNLKSFAKKGMLGRGRSIKDKNEILDDVDNAVPGGSASKPPEDPDEYGDSRLPDNLQHLDDVEDDDVTVVMMSGRKMPRAPKFSR